jgi:hypothetical protein
VVAENISRCGRERRWSGREKSREHEEENGGMVRRLGERQQHWSAASSSTSCVVQEEEEKEKKEEKKERPACPRSWAAQGKWTGHTKERKRPRRLGHVGCTN